MDEEDSGLRPWSRYRTKSFRKLPLLSLEYLMSTARVSRAGRVYRQ